jgi:hypothetical protein
MADDAKAYVAWTEIDAARVIILEVLESDRLKSGETAKHFKVILEKLDDLLCCAQNTLDPAGEFSQPPVPKHLI